VVFPGRQGTSVELVLAEQEHDDAKWLDYFLPINISASSYSTHVLYVTPVLTQDYLPRPPLLIFVDYIDSVASHFRTAIFVAGQLALGIDK
jgi:hypothetical protein